MKLVSVAVLVFAASVDSADAEACNRVRDMNLCNSRDDCVQISQSRCAEKRQEACENVSEEQACNDVSHCEFDHDLDSCLYSACEMWDRDACKTTFGIPRCDFKRNSGCVSKKCNQIRVQQICKERSDCILDESNGRCMKLSSENTVNPTTAGPTLTETDENACKEISENEICDSKSHCTFDNNLGLCLYRACEEWNIDICASVIGEARCDLKRKGGCTTKRCSKIRDREVCTERQDCSINESNGKCVSLPTTSDPTTADPTTADPTTADPTTSDPTTADPTTADPTTSDPTTADPTTADPTTADPTTADPTTSDPTTADPTTADPTTSDPTTADPTTADPTTADPTTADPTTADPTTADPTTADPTTADPTTADPTTADPTTADPTTADPTTADPTTADPTTADPTMSEFKLAVEMIDLDSSGLSNENKIAVIQAFDRAVEKWKSVIVETTNFIPFSPKEDMPSRTCFNMFTFSDLEKRVGDILIGGVMKQIDGVGGILGSAGPCALGQSSNGNYYTRVGGMTFDSDDVANMIENGIFDGVVEHEMGHCLGIGTLWGRPDLGFPFVSYENNEYVWNDAGVNAIDANTRLKNSNTRVSPIIENDGGSGTAGGHWDEVEYTNELMTGYVNQNMRLSELTIGALEDLKYGVSYNNADSNSFPNAEIGRINPSKSKHLREARPEGDIILLNKKNRKIGKIKF